MLFVDCTEWCKKRGKTIEDVEKAAWDVGVACQDGRMFHGLCHLRINLALPLSRVQEAFHRLDKYVFNVVASKINISCDHFTKLFYPLITFRLICADKGMHGKYIHAIVVG